MLQSTDRSWASPLAAIFRPTLRRKPLPELPRTLYGYVYWTSCHQQIGLVLLTLLVFPLTLAPLELQRRIVDGAVADGDIDALTVLAAIYLAVVIALALFKYARNLYAAHVEEGIARLLRRRFVASGKEGFWTDAEDGTRQAILATESEKVGGFVAESIAFPFMQAGIILSVGGYMLFVNPTVAAVALLLILPAAVVVIATQPALNRLSGRKIDATRKLGEQTLENGDDPDSTDGHEAADGLITRIHRLRLRFAMIKFAAKGINNTINHLGPLSVLVVGGVLVIRGEAQLGTVVAFMSGFERLTSPIRELLNFYRRVAMAKVQYRLLREADSDGTTDGATEGATA